jgi:hypothetical protein
MDNAVKKDILIKFGDSLIKFVRDRTINEEIKTLKGDIKDQSSLKIYEKLSGLSTGEINAIEELIIDAIDGTLNNFLWMIEQANDFDLVACKSCQFYSLKEISDGLSVDYWNFVDSYSKYRRL